MKKYTIQSGDTLGIIAKKFYGDASKYKQIAEANDIENVNIISVGQELVLPGLEEEKKEEHSEKKEEASNTFEGSIFTLEALKSIMKTASQENLEKYVGPLNEEMEKFEINTPLRAAHFIAQLAHESGSFKFVSENLNYSAKALRAVFGKYFPTDELAEAYARQPEKIANRVYANRMQNGDEQSGDGWKFRGRGLIQLTGKENYTKCGEGLDLDLLNTPEQLAENPNAAVGAAGWFWNSRNLNKYADLDDLKTVTKRINGGYNGLEDREKYLLLAKEALDI